MFFIIIRTFFLNTNNNIRFIVLFCYANKSEIFMFIFRFQHTNFNCHIIFYIKVLIARKLCWKCWRCWFGRNLRRNSMAVVQVLKVLIWYWTHVQILRQMFNFSRCWLLYVCTYSLYCIVHKLIYRLVRTISTKLYSAA